MTFDTLLRETPLSLLLQGFATIGTPDHLAKAEQEYVAAEAKLECAYRRLKYAQIMCKVVGGAV